MIDLSRIIPLIESMSESHRQEQLNLWEKNLSDWQSALVDAKSKGFEIDIHMEMITQILLIIKLLKN